MSSPPEQVEQVVLDDLRARLLATRLVQGTGAAGRAPNLGIARARVAEVVAAWARYDWRPSESLIRGLPWIVAGEADAAVRAVSQPAASESRSPAVVLLHGWPDSVLRYERVLPLLRDVTVIVPALPGFPFSVPGTTFEGYGAVADRLAAATVALGHGRVVLSAGDIGAGVAEQWAVRHPDHVAALHLSDVPANRLTALDVAALDAEGRRFLSETERWMRSEGTYLLQQRAKPDTLSVGLGDSPAGLAGWIVDKLDAWSEQPVPLETVLTWLTAYWVTGTIGTSFAAYAAEEPAVAGPLQVPIVLSAFESDPAFTPHSVAARALPGLDRRLHRGGGHWPSMEQPEVFVEDLHRALQLSGST